MMLRTSATALASRLRAMSRDELSWRVRTELRTRADHAASLVRTPSWRREDIADALAVETLPSELQQAIERSQWSAVHRLLMEVLRRRPSRFVLNPAAAADVTAEIRSRWPDATTDAVTRARAISDGRFDLLGYRDLSFAPRDADRAAGQRTIDWHFDPVHQRRMPMAFWSQVPYLDPGYGDHKVVWELNRQQHWLALSRALWLTGDKAYADEMIRDFTGWMVANPPLLGANWASMLELSFRSLSWLWGLHAMLAVPANDDGDSVWLVDLVVGLDRQLTQVERNLSRYFSPNTHLTGEALALYVGGAALPELAASTRWIDTGRAVLIDEIDRQIERDGGHAERSTHYHRYTLDFYLLALLTARRIGDTDAAVRFADAVERLAPFARAMADGQGRLPRIGDDDAGRLWPIADRDSADIRDSLALAAAAVDRREWAPWGATEEVVWLTSNDRESLSRALSAGMDDRRVRERRTLTFRAVVRPVTHSGERSVLSFPDAERRRMVAERRGAGVDRRMPTTDGSGNDRRITRVFPQTGYVTSATETGDHLVLDAGPHGYLNGGHAHADALAVVLTLRHRPLLVDPGTPTYTMDATLRDSSRSSIGHNTVTVDGLSSAVPKGPFHWQTRADAQLEVIRQNARFALIQATHDGYRAGSHRRIILATDRGYLFLDQISGDGQHDAAQHWHFDPRWQVGCEADRSLRLIHESGESAWLVHDRGDVVLVHADTSSPLGWVSPAYGIRVPAWSARVTHRGRTPFALVSWCGTAAADVAPVLDRIDDESAADAVATRLRIGALETLSIVRPMDAGSTPSTVTVSGVETDARALQMTTDGDEWSSLCVADGTSVRLGTDLTIEADGRVADLHVAMNGTRLELSASVPPARIRMAGAALQRVTQIVANGHPVRQLRTKPTELVLIAADWSPTVDRLELQEQHDVRNRRLR